LFLVSIYLLAYWGALPGLAGVTVPPCTSQDLDMLHDCSVGICQHFQPASHCVQATILPPSNETYILATERTGSDSDENHEERSLGISVANGGGYGREPFVRIAVVLVLDDLVKME
jgi:hypothetical protein